MQLGCKEVGEITDFFFTTLTTEKHTSDKFRMNEVVGMSHVSSIVSGLPPEKGFQRSRQVVYQK